MPVVQIIALIQALIALVPEAAAAFPAIQNALNGTATDADIATLQQVTANLNAMADQAEQAATVSGGAD